MLPPAPPTRATYGLRVGRERSGATGGSNVTQRYARATQSNATNAKRARSFAASSRNERARLLLAFVALHQASRDATRSDAVPVVACPLLTCPLWLLPSTIGSLSSSFKRLEGRGVDRKVLTCLAEQRGNFVGRHDSSTPSRFTFKKSGLLLVWSDLCFLLSDGGDSRSRDNAGEACAFQPGPASSAAIHSSILSRKACASERPWVRKALMCSHLMSRY